MTKLYGLTIQEETPTPDNPIEIKNLIVNEEAQEYIEKQNKEIERLNNIIKEVREKIEEKVGNEIHDMMYVIDVSEVLEILDKVEEKK